MELVKVSIPLDSGSFEARIDPTRSYGGIPGSELIDKYSRKNNGHKPTPRFVSCIVWSNEKKQGLTVSADHTIGKGTQEQVLNLGWIPKTLRQTYRLQLPTGEFPESIKIGIGLYDPLRICLILEEILHKKIVCRRGDRPIKTQMNLTYDIPIITDGKEAPLVIIGKKNIAYVLAPRIED